MALTGLTPIQITNLNVSGIATFEQEVGVGGTLTYQDVTNVDAIGIITARAGVNVSAGQLDVGNNINVGIGITRASTDDIHLMKNVPIPQGSSFEFMSGNKIVLETTDTITAKSDVASSLDVALTIMEIT